MPESVTCSIRPCSGGFLNSYGEQEASVTVDMDRHYQKVKPSVLDLDYGMLSVSAILPEQIGYGRQPHQPQNMISVYYINSNRWIQIPTDATIGELKDRMDEPRSQTQVMYNDRPLDDYATVAQSGICNGGTVTIKPTHLRRGNENDGTSCHII